MEASFGFSPHHFGSGTIVTVLRVWSRLEILKAPAVTGGSFTQPLLNWAGVDMYFAG